MCIADWLSLLRIERRKTLVPHQVGVCILLVLWALFATGCGGNEGVHFVNHPTPVNLDQAEPVGHFQETVAGRQWSRRLSSVSAGRSTRLELHQPFPNYVLRRRVAVLPDQGYALMDERSGMIRLLGSAGETLDSILIVSRAGKRFAEPRDLSADHTGMIWLLDGGNQITAFAKVAGQYAIARQFELSGTSEHICALNGRVIVRAADMGRESLFHTYSTKLGRLASFGRVYRDSDPFIAWRLSGGPIGCDQSSDIVVAAYDYSPRIDAFTADGVRLWSFRLPISVKRATSTHRNGKSSLRMHASPSEYISTITSVGPGLLLAEVWQEDTKQGKGARSTRHLLIESKSGRMQWLHSDGALRILAVASDGLAFSTEPFIGPIWLAGALSEGSEEQP